MSEKRFDMIGKLWINSRIDQVKQQLSQTDEILQSDHKDADLLEDRVMALDIAQKDKLLIQDYTACLASVWSRTADLSYMAGMKDTITLLQHLHLLKENDSDTFFCK